MHALLQADCPVLYAACAVAATLIVSVHYNLLLEGQGSSKKLEYMETSTLLHSCENLVAISIFAVMLGIPCGILVANGVVAFSICAGIIGGLMLFVVFFWIKSLLELQRNSRKTFDTIVQRLKKELAALEEAEG